MNSRNYSANIFMRKMKRTFTYNRRPVLTLSVSYPRVTLRDCPQAQNRINAEIWDQVHGFLQYVSDDLYREAVASYKQSQENGFPFHPYDAVLQYNITYNRQCHLSLYRDQYTFTGGAHGNTVRLSDTWKLTNGRRVPLSDFFPSGQDYKSFLIEQITRQAHEISDILFEDYPALISQYFNEEHYYLTSSGIAIYYQQYEIAPYSSGIVVFTIPYLASLAPSCCN